jgi:hypothetical protein
MIRRIGLAAILAFVLTACNSGNKPKDGISAEDVNNTASAEGSNKSGLPDIQFEEEEHDFGKITQGEKVSFAFKFRNTGKSNLIITSAAGSCGCTIPEWPKEPIAPGKEGKINVIFNSEGKSGIQEKTISIVTNCEPSTKIVRIKTEIIVPTTLDEQ